MKSLGLQNGVGKYFSRMVQNILKVLAYCRDQTPCFLLKCLSTDPNGRFVIAKIKLGDEVFLASVYAPCDSQQQSLFIQNLCTDIVSKTNTSRIIIAGEFILWNNRDINIENKSVFWKAWRDKNVTNKELK